jgi:hypothetical protein
MKSSETKTPAENAATVRDALDELPIVPDAVFVKRQKGRAALDALEAQAKRPWWRGADEMRAELRAAEDERDRLETLIAQQLTPLDVAVTHIQILRRKGDDYSAEERDNVAAIVETHASEARSALFAALDKDKEQA